MITADDSPLVRTHDEARAVITHAVPGARVAFRAQTARSCSYEITVRRWGAPSVCVVGGYTLPCLADRIASHAREQVEKEMRQ